MAVAVLHRVDNRVIGFSSRARQTFSGSTVRRSNGFDSITSLPQIAFCYNETSTTVSTLGTSSQLNRSINELINSY